jgi:hypothetical protein
VKDTKQIGDDEVKVITAAKGHSYFWFTLINRYMPKCTIGLKRCRLIIIFQTSSKNIEICLYNCLG